MSNNIWTQTPVLRRAALFVLLLGGIWRFLAPEPGFWQVARHDWPGDYWSRYTNAEVWDNSFLPLATFLAQQQGDYRVIFVQGAAWDTLAAGLPSGQPRRLPLDAEPLDAIAAQTRDPVQLVVQGAGGPAFLSLYPEGPGGAGGGFTWDANRLLGLGLAVAGLLVYFFLPWRQKAPGALAYTRGKVMVGDLFGVVLAGFFFAVPLVIYLAASYGPVSWGLTSPGAIFLAVGVLVALLPGAALVSGAFYEALEIQLTPQSLMKRSLLGVREVPWDQITLVKPAVWGLPRWLEIVLGLLILLSDRPQAALLLGGKEFGLTLVLAGGRELNLWLTGLPGRERLFEEIKSRGVPLDPTLAQAWAPGA
ncbi:MAG: hypothetical protein KQJ78_01240 [Deltaproteobacteria bacterium]|nr:hypothetical protein [Deltaproteobacteria bacterium]